MRSGPPNVVSNDHTRIATAHQYMWMAQTLSGICVSNIARMNGFSPMTRTPNDNQERYRPRLGGALPLPLVALNNGESLTWCARVYCTLRSQKRAAYR